MNVFGWPFLLTINKYLESLPTLKEGMIVHDIFPPKNYPKQWLEDEIRFWNEQYLLEAFLSYNSNWRILGALNYLQHNHYDELKLIAPFLTPDREPGSFYIQKMTKIDSVSHRNDLKVPI